MLELGEIVTVHVDFIVPDGALGKITGFYEESVDGPFANIRFFHEIKYHGKRCEGVAIWIKLEHLKKLDAGAWDLTIEYKDFKF